MKLPTFDDLSKEQDQVYNLPLDGDHLVTGPPGTGKSVMALYRTQALTFDDRDPTVLMFSNVLKQYTVDAARELDLAGNVQTFHSWFGAFWRRHYGGPPPKLESDQWAFDWHAMMATFASAPPPPGELDDLLVDEGQDLPTEFYGLVKWLARNVTVFADENQQLRDSDSTLAEIGRLIGVSEHHTLTRNYRNSREIAELAQHYYVGGPTGIPDVPERRGDRPTLRRFAQLNDVVEQIAMHARAHSDRTIGVACKYTRNQKSLHNRLQARRLPVPVQTYIGKDQQHRSLDFDTPGVKIINYASIKGLEFDTLYVPQLELVDHDASSASVRMAFYVISSRARRELHLSWCGPDERPPPIVADVPHDVLEHM